MELVVTGIQVDVPKGKTTLEFQHGSNGRTVTKVYEFVNSNIALLNKYDVELTDDERQYLETGHLQDKDKKMPRDYVGFQGIVFQRAQDIAKLCDFSGHVQNDFRQMLEDESATKDQIKQHLRSFIDESDEAISKLKEVRTAVISILAHYSEVDVPK